MSISHIYLSVYDFDLERIVDMCIEYENGEAVLCSFEHAAALKSSSPSKSDWANRDWLRPGFETGLMVISKRCRFEGQGAP